jgi:hypothetical protein
MLVFKIIVGALGLIAIATGVNDFWNGASVQGDFGKQLGDSVNDPTLNFTLRFFGAIWMGFGVLLILFITDLQKYQVPLMVSFGIVILGGIGRIISILKHGIESGNESMSYVILAVEIIIVPVLLIWFYFYGSNQSGSI